MIWLFNLSVALLLVGMLMGPLYKLLAPAWAAGSTPKRARKAPRTRANHRRQP